MSQDNNYNEYKSVNYPEIATDILEFWKKNNVFEQSVNNRKDAPSFTFFEGPPSANGTPGIHHVMARTIKDIFCRYKTLKGFKVDRKGGWDTHGLPVELQVEKELGITKEDIGKKISVKEYNEKCKEAVMKYKELWDELTEKMGYWVDLDNPYVTFEQEYIESVWNLLQKMYDKGLLYKGYTVQPYSPAAGTGLSSHELNQPGCYRDVKDTSITAQFKLKEEDNTFILAWTTTPWTLPGNSALAVGAKIKYVKVQTFNQYTFEPINVILAKDRFSAYFNSKHENIAIEDYKPGDKNIPYKIIGEYIGTDLIGKSYEQLMPYIPLPHPAFTIIAADYVTTEDGTGIVHMARAFGADDNRVCEQAGVPGIFIKDEKGRDLPIVDKKGCFVKEITDFAGLPVKNYNKEDESAPNYKSTDVLIAIKLKEDNRAFKVEKYVHSYPHCWRTDMPVLYYPLDSWFIKTTALKEELVKANKLINWKPSSTGEKRFGNWLENLVDWNLSRSRYWGTPLPIWRSEDESEEICIGSIEQLKLEVDKVISAGFKQDPIDDNFDLHRPYVDDIILVSESGKPMKREADLIDVWFDSGAMPYAQWHYPFENKEKFEQNFPADFIAEGVDQTRGWFFTLHAIGVLLFDQPAFKNVIANGLVLDKMGNKMSKRIGNAVDPFKTFDKHGPDATRWYMVSNANPWDNLKFDEEKLKDSKNRFFGTLQNTYNFFTLYANLDAFDFNEKQIELSKRPEDDRWVLSKLNSLIKEVDDYYERYEPTKACRAIQDFTTEDLSNWYVRLNRKRFWMGEYNENKKSAFQTLYNCLETIAILSSPVMPFYSDKLYRDLKKASNSKTVSVHLADFTSSNHTFIDKELEEKVAFAQTVSSLGHSLRKKHRLKVRQPLQKLMIPALNEKTKKMLDAVRDQIMNEINVKEIELIDQNSEMLSKKAKPNFKKLGKTYGKMMKPIASEIQAFNNAQILELQNGSTISLTIDDQNILIGNDDVEIVSEDIPGWSIASEGSITVALDITLSDELKKEGFSRDLINRIQNTRKDKGLEIQDRILVSIITDSSFIKESANAYEKYICREVQADSLQFDTVKNKDYTTIEIDNYQFSLKIVKA